MISPVTSVTSPTHAFQAAIQATVAWRREAQCHPAEYARRSQVLLQLEAIADQVTGQPGR